MEVLLILLYLHCFQADQFSDFHIRSVLCVPIWNSNHQIIGKLKRKFWSVFDVYVCIPIAYINSKTNISQFCISPVVHHKGEGVWTADHCIHGLSIQFKHRPPSFCDGFPQEYISETRRWCQTTTPGPHVGVQHIQEVLEVAAVFPVGPRSVNRRFVVFRRESASVELFPHNDVI